MLKKHQNFMDFFEGTDLFYLIQKQVVIIDKQFSLPNNAFGKKPKKNLKQKNWIKKT